MKDAEIRVAEEGDADSILSIYAPFVLETAISFEIEPPGLQEMRSRVVGGLETHPWLVVQAEGAVQGYAYATAFRRRQAYQWSVENSVYVAPAARCRGWARALYTVLHRLLVMQGFVTAWAGITLPNAPSVAFHEAVGFSATGTLPHVGFKHGAWRDVGWWTKELRDRPRDPQPPRPFADLQDSSELSALLLER